MPTPEIRVFKNLEELSRGAVEEFVTLARQSHPGGAPFSAALSGGSTPKRFYELLATGEFSSQAPWQRIELFQVDERCVPPDDARSNYKMMREALLDRIPGIHFHRMAAGQPDRDAAARSYAAELRSALGAQPRGWPRLDVIYLGMGDDGHTASLFPGTPALDEMELAVVPNYVPKFEMYRLTLTLPVLNAAGRVVFLVSGAGKAERLRQALRTPSGATPPFPSQLVNPEHGAVAWYVDEAAAELL
ncbi:MAG: 6-phosphogluconolactonase [Terriglobia bacterium]